MKKLHSVAIKSFIAIIILSTFAFSHTMLTSDLPWQEGNLDGDVSVSMNKPLFNVSGRTLEGQYKNNQKVGTWKLWDKNHKLLQERVYKNDFEYNIVKKDKEIDTKFPLKRDEAGMYPFPKIEEKDVAYAQRLWKIIPEKYMQHNNMLSYIFHRIDFSQFQAYTDEDLRIKDSTNQIKTLNFDELTSIRIMGDWYYDSKRKISVFQTLAISPVIDEDNRAFWFYYPEMRESLLQIEAESDNSLINNLDDKFFFTDFPTYIYKIEGKEQTKENKADLPTKTQEVIEHNLQVEAALWLK